MNLRSRLFGELSLIALDTLLSTHIARTQTTKGDDMAEQNLHNDEILNESDLDQVSGGVVLHEDKIRNQEQADKLKSQEQADKLRAS